MFFVDVDSSFRTGIIVESNSISDKKTVYNTSWKESVNSRNTKAVPSHRTTL